MKWRQCSPDKLSDLTPRRHASCGLFNVQVSTLIGYGSPNKADSHDVHGAPLGKDETAATRENLKWNYGRV